MLELIIHQEVHVGGVDRPPPASDVRAVLEKQAVGLVWGRFGRSGCRSCRFGWRRRGCRRRHGNTELDDLNFMDVDGLRLIPNLDVKLLGVAGFHGPRDLAAILEGDDVGEEPVAGQQAEMPEDQQQDSSHNHTPDSRFTLHATGVQAAADHFENDPEIEFASNAS
jgi:hypothetical protein